MKKILSILCGIILATTALWAEQIDVILSAPDNTSNPLITQTMGTLGGEKTLLEAWKGGEDGNSQQALMLNKKVGIGNNEASITFASPDYTIIHKYSFNVWYDWISKSVLGREYNTNYKPEYKVNNDSYVTPGTTSNTNKFSKVYSSQELKFTTNRKGISINIPFVGSFDAEYRVFSNNWTFGITIPEVILPTDNPTTTLNKITESELLAGDPTRTATLIFTVKDPIGTTSETIKDYFEASIISSNGNTWSLGDTWTVTKVQNIQPIYVVDIPVTFKATTDEAGNFQATVQLKPKHNVQYNEIDYSVGRTQIVKVAVNQKGTYAIDWKPDGWENNGTITIYKGDSYERNDYLKNTDGLTLAIPASSNPSVVSVDPTTGEITATEEGSTVLTYTQSGNDDYEEKTLTLNVNVIKRTPVFTLNSESTYTEGGKTYHVFYPNKSYPNFVTTSNGDLVNYPVTITPEGDMTNIISFNGVSAKVESALKDGIKITIFQQSGDLWYENLQDFYISIRNNPMHVGTLCERTLQELFNDNYGYNEAKFENNSIVLGSNSKNTNGGYIIFRFEGTPDKLECSYETTKDQDNSATWSLTQSIDGISFYPLGVGNTFDVEARYVKVAISGSYKDWTQTTYGVMGEITDLCITERVGVEILPAEIELVKIGNEVKSAAFSAEVSNLTNVVLTISSSEFGLARTESDESQTSITLDYMDGLGIDQFATIPLVVKYKGVADDSAIGKTCTITAKDADGKQLAVANVEVTGIILVDGVPQMIFQPNATNTGIYTGTNKNSNDFPYHTKRQVNLSRCFDTNTGMALFDILYIFGITTNTSDGDEINAPTDVLVCNAKTPCYVYHKDDATGNKYVYHETFDAASKRFDHGTTMSGKHLYFTGYCPFAYVGDQYTQNGWMYFQGKTGVSDQVDIYLDSCQIFARLKTPNGNHGAYNNYDLVLSIEQLGETENDINYNYLSGYSSPFVFTSGTKNSGTSFRPTIHIAGKNHVKGQLGSLIHNTIADVTPVLGALGSLAGDVTKINLGISGVNTYSAPIAVKPTDVGQYTDLTMTDIWKDNTITNGYIRLDAADVLGKVAEAALSIDLGSATGSLTINGGQYHMRNAAADGNYTCNLAVGYKMYNRSEEALGATLQVRLYGFGDDQTDSKVTINSGTFTMYKNMYVLSPGNYLGTDYYKDQTNFLDLRLPAGNGNSRINGGTFNGISNVVTCKSTISTGADPTNGKYWLTLWDVPITGTNPDGSAQFSLDDIELIQVAYPAEPIVTYTLVNDIENVKNANQYGGQSANAYKKTIDAVEKDVVTLLLPGDLFGLPEKSEVQLRNWVTAVPYLEASKELAGLLPVSLTLGGPIDVEVSSESENIKYENKQLIFADLEGLEGYQYTIEAQGAGMKIKENENAFGKINNTDSYEITNNLNLLKVVQADTWYTFTAPFDVHEISVIEANNASYNESTIAQNSRADAMKLQAEANLHFMYGIYTFIIPNEDGRASSLSFDEMLGQSYVLQNKQKLNHYNGTNLMDAHYYLYEPGSLDANGDFSTNGTGDALNIDWKPVNRNADEPLLKKGQTYAMQFPWCPMCNDLASRTYYDYWSNKMILFYGAGAQTIEGSSSQSTSSPAEGTAKLTGNSTFADMTLAAKTGYVHNTTTDYFEQKNASYTLKPTEGFLLYNPGAKSMPARISRSGQIEYDENTETGVDGVPTVGDRTSLMLFGAYDGFEVLALHEQLVTVYNLQGNIIFQQYMTAGEQVYVATGAGIYVVRGEKETIKVMVD